MNQEIREKLAINVKKLREGKRLKREELSLILGVDNSYVSKLEKCKINITLDKLILIANYFNVPFINLFK